MTGRPTAGARTWLTFLAAALLTSSPAATQEHLFSFVLALPSGEFAEFAGEAAGLEYAALFGSGRDGVLRLRAGTGFLFFSPVSDRVCVFSETAGCRREFHATSTRSFYYLALGPQVTASLGRWRPYAHAGTGVSLFNSSTDQLGGAEGERNLTTAGMDWLAGGGIALGVSGLGLGLSAFDMGARFQGGTRVRYQPRAEIAEDAEGRTTMSPTPGPRSVLVFHLGFALIF